MLLKFVTDSARQCRLKLVTGQNADQEYNINSVCTAHLDLIDIYVCSRCNSAPCFVVASPVGRKMIGGF